MKRLTIGVAVWLGCMTTSASASELRLAWQGVSGDTVTLAEGEEAVIEIWLEVSAGDTVSGVGYDNELLPDVVQVSLVANDSVGWTADGTAGTSLGDGQSVLLFGAAESVLDGPGEYLLATQTVRLATTPTGSNLEVAIDANGLTVTNESGGFHTLVASDQAMSDTAGFVHLGLGSSGYTDSQGSDDARTPLIIQLPGTDPPPTDPPASGPCGVGVAAALPVTLLGLFACRLPRRFRR